MAFTATCEWCNLRIYWNRRRRLWMRTTGRSPACPLSPTSVHDPAEEARRAYRTQDDQGQALPPDLIDALAERARSERADAAYNLARSAFRIGYQAAVADVGEPARQTHPVLTAPNPSEAHRG